MMIRFKQLVRSAKCVVLSALAATALGSTAFGDAVLTQDEDWRGHESEMLTGTIDLNGHKLTVSALPTTCTITDTVGGYEYLDSITSTGSQFVNTGYKPNDKTVVEAKFNVKTPTTGWGEFFACSSDDGCKSNKYPPPTGFSAGWDTYRCRWNNDKTANKIAGFVGGKSVQVDAKGDSVVTVKLENGKFTVNGKENTFTAAPAYTGTLDLYIFGCNCPYPWGSGSADRARNTAANDLYRAQAMTLYSFKITENGVVQRDFLPAKRVSDGKVGLLDRQNGVFYPNKASSGVDFTAGTVTNTVASGELHVNVASGTVTGSATLTGTATLVKDGEGTFKWNGGANSVATTCPVVITNGVFGFATDADNVFGNGGTITIAGKGQMDISKNSKNGGGAYSPVLNRTLYIEGDGPDGKGAIVRNVSKGDWGDHLKVVHLTGDATIGGKSRIDFRGNNRRLYGHGFTLTVKNTAMLSFCNGN